MSESDPMVLASRSDQAADTDDAGDSSDEGSSPEGKQSSLKAARSPGDEGDASEPEGDASPAVPGGEEAAQQDAAAALPDAEHEEVPTEPEGAAGSRDAARDSGAEPTDHPEVDSALARLAALDQDLATSEHVPIFEATLRDLQRALADNPGTEPGQPDTPAQP